MIIKYTGITAVAGVWFLLVLPSYIAKYDHKKLPASYAGDVNKIRNYFNLGLIIVGASQFLFLLYIYRAYPNLNLLIPLLVGSIGSISLITLSHLTFKKHVHFHYYLAILYFVFMTLGNLLFAYKLRGIDVSVSVFIIVSFLIALLGLIDIYFVKKAHAYSEYWYSMFASFGTLGFYLYF